MKTKIVLELKKKSNAEIVLAAARYLSSMTGNSLFAAPDIVAQVNATATATANLNDAMTLPMSEAKTGQVRRARAVLDWNLNVLASKVEAVANDPSLPDEQRAGIVHSASMGIRARKPRLKQVFAIKNGEEEGSVYLTAKGGAPAHEWQYTKDLANYTNRVSARTTRAANITITNLDSLVKYAFFHRAVASVKVDPQWEGPLIIMVH